MSEIIKEFRTFYRYFNRKSYLCIMNHSEYEDNTDKGNTEHHRQERT